jgi:hypothetical protein
MQDFYTAQLDNGKSFSVHNPIVEVIQCTNSSHTAEQFIDWDMNNACIHARGECIDLADWDSNDVYVVLPGSRSLAGTIGQVGLIGMSVFIGLDNMEGDPTNWFVHMLFALGAHELAHAISDLANEDNESIMGGSINWPYCYFTTGDIETLNGLTDYFSTNYVHSTGTPYYTYTSSETLSVNISPKGVVII